MARKIIAASILAISANIASSSAEEYDLWTVTSDERVIIAVSIHDDAKIASVASGTDRKALNILGADDSRKVFSTLRASVKEHSLKRVLSSNDPSLKQRFATIKKKADAEQLARGSGHDDGSAAPARMHKKENVQLADPAKSEKVKADNIKARGAVSGSETKVIQTAENGVARKIVVVSGADEKAARKFVLEADGLDAAERQAMLKAVGLQPAPGG